MMRLTEQETEFLDKVSRCSGSCRSRSSRR